MWKKILSSVGIGAATVDTKLDKDVLKPGELLKAEIVISGGDVEQQMSGLELALMTQAEVETQDGEYLQNHALQSWKIAQPFTVGPGEKKVFEFEATLHPETPVTELPCRFNKTQVWVQTGLAIDLARDAKDTDRLRIQTTPAMVAFLSAVEACGFRLHQADVEKGFLRGSNFQSRSGCYQELEFRPSGGQWTIKQVEVSFVPEADRTHVLLEVDRTFRGDAYRSLTLSHGDLDVDRLARQIKGLIG